MTNIVRPDGHVLTTLKRQHNPERTQAHRMQLSKLMEELLKGYTHDMEKDPQGATPPNEPAIIEHYNDAWLTKCRAIKSSSEPVEVDEEAFMNNVRVLQRQRERGILAQKPIHELNPDELAEFNLVMVAWDMPLGSIYMSDRFALVVDRAGHVYLHLPDIADAEAWCDALIARLGTGMAHVVWKHHGYTIVQLLQLWSGMPLPRFQKPSSQQLQAASMALLVRKWWNPRTW